MRIRAGKWIECGAMLWLLAAAPLIAGTPESGAAAGVSQDPAGRAENVRFEVGEGGVIRVFYDLVAENPQQLVSVRLLVSQDGGQTFDLAALSVSGDVGPAVVPGSGKRIAWEAARDTERIDASLLRFRVVVTAMTALQTPRRFWGVNGGFGPDSQVPSWLSKSLFNTQLADLNDAEFRIGFVRGRTLGGDWGISFVRKRLKQGSSLVRRGQDRASGDPLARTTYSVTENVWASGAELHTFLPFLRLGDRAQLGVLLGVGLSTDFNGDVERITEGTIYATNPSLSSPTPPRTVSVGPGFVWAPSGGVLQVGPGQTAVVERVGSASLRVSGWDIDARMLARAQLGAAFSLNRQVKLRVSGGFNFPGFEVLSIEIANFFSVP